ncbi:MAG: NAD-dependent epimerase/dehydratase family protein [Ruminococcaceae bacterium]|nr:NAD-dependent epimerase/dehydratase family protein [Oscillospiraceae bacterium]
MEKIFSNAESRTFLVTGASGFLGKATVEWILNEGGKVIGMDLVIADKLKEMNNPNLTLIQADLTKDYEFPAGVTDVIHAAGRVSDWGAYELFYEANFVATTRLMKLAKEAGVKNFLFISTIDIHGLLGHMDETEDGIYYDPPTGFYAQTKKITEKAVREFNSDEMKTVCIRPCTVYGPGDTTVQGPIMDAILSGQMGVIDGGKYLTSRVYITDLVQGLCRALEFGTGGDAYNIVSGEKITWKEWVAALSAELGVKPPKLSSPYFIAYLGASILEDIYKLFRIKSGPILTRMRIQHAGHDFYFLPTKAKEELGYEPQMPWPEGIKIMVAEYKERKGLK